MDVFGKDLPAPTDATPKPEEKAKIGETASKPPESTPTPAAGVIGPAIPTDKDYDPEELKKAEEHKTKGNEFFKGKFRSFFIFYILLFYRE